MKITTEIYNSLNNKLFLEWELAWKNNENSHIFNSPYWYRACINTYNQKDQLIIVCRSKTNTIDAIFPLVKSRKYGFDVYMSPGDINLDKSTLFITGQNKLETIRQLFKELLKFKNLYLTEIDEHLAQLITANTPIIKKSLSSTSRFLPIGSDPLKYVKLRYINEIEKNKKALGNNVSVKFDCCPNSKDIALVQSIEKQSLKSIKEISFFDNNHNKKLIVEISRQNPELLRFAILYHQKKAIAADMGYSYNNIYKGFYSVYDNNYKKFGPGKMIQYMIVPILKNIGFSVFDMSRGETSFKREITPHSYNQYTIYYFKNPITMFLWNLIYKIKPFLDKHDKILEFFRVNANKIIKIIK